LPRPAGPPPAARAPGLRRSPRAPRARAAEPGQRMCSTGAQELGAAGRRQTGGCGGRDRCPWTKALGFSSSAPSLCPPRGPLQPDGRLHGEVLVPTASAGAQPPAAADRPPSRVQAGQPAVRGCRGQALAGAAGAWPLPFSSSLDSEACLCMSSEAYFWRRARFFFSRMSLSMSFSVGTST